MAGATGSDIQLLFGALGGGSLSGESGRLIQGQLTQIMEGLNGKLNVKVGIDTSSGSNKSWSDQLQDKLNKISESGKFSIQISDIKVSNSAIANFKKQIGSIVNTLTLSGGTEVTVSSKGVGAIKSELKDVQSELRQTESDASSARAAISKLGSSTKALSKTSGATDLEALLKRIADMASQARGLLGSNMEASSVSAGVGSVSYQRLTENLVILDDVLKECRGDANNLSGALNGIDIGAVLSQTSTAISTLKNELIESGFAGSVSLRSLEETATRMQNLLNQNMQMKDSDIFVSIERQIASFNTVLESCNGDSKKLEEALRSAGLNGAAAIENAKSAMASFKAELANTEAVVGSVNIFRQASKSVEDYYKLLSTASKSSDIALTPDGWWSVSGSYNDLAKALNNAASSYQKFTSSSAKSKMTNNELLNLTQLLERKERDLAVATEARRSSQINALLNQSNAIKTTISSMEKSANGEEEAAKIGAIKTQYEQWAASINEVRDAKDKLPAKQTERLSKIKADGDKIRENVNALIDANKIEADETKNTNAELSAKSNLYGQIKNAINDVTEAQRKWTASENGKTSEEYAKLKEYISRLNDLQNKLGNLKPGKAKDELSRITSAFKDTSQAIHAAGEDTQTFSSRIGNLAKKFGTWFSITRVIMTVIQSIKRMVQTTIELDEAMTQLKIVTNATDQEYSAYSETISKTAKDIGSSINDLVDSATTYARLGYSLDESGTLAKFTAMLQNVGDIDVSDAQDAITAIVKAFGISVDDIESVMDKLVTTGNNFPISVSQIAEGMNNASSALAAAGNTFDQSVALLTAANTTIQNAAKSSTGLRTIAARLRSTKTELDELGETMTEAEYGDLVSALTKYNVELKDANGEFRSTYDIVADIAAIWKNLSTMDQAALANAIAGVRQQSVFYSLVEQFQEASGAMDDMANSAGALQSSYDTLMESTSAHINQFKAAFQSLSQTTFSPDFLNGIIDFGTGLMGVLETVVKLVNALGGLGTVLSTIGGILVATNVKGICATLQKAVDPIKGIIAGIDGMIASGLSFRDVVLTAFSQATAGATGLQAAIGGIGIALTVLPLAITVVSKVFDALIVTAEEATEKMEESFSEFENATKKVDDLNNELQTTDERIRELESQDTLTFVEESELQKLRESVKLLQIQADLAEKDRAREAEKAANDTVAAYRKNFKSDITSDAVQNYTEYANTTGIDEALFYDKSNIAALLVGIEQMKRLRDEAKESGEDYVHFQSIIDDTTDSIWKQADVLSTYKSNLESIPYDELTDEQKSALDEINTAIETIYKKLDPAKWKDIQWNSIINDAQYEDDAKKLNELASQSKVTADVIKSQFPSLLKACEDAGLEITDVVNNLNTAAEQINAKGLSEYKDQIESLPDALSDLESSYSALKSAQEDMAGGGGLSADTIKDLADAEENYVDYLYEENGAVKLNTAAWEENAKSKTQKNFDEIQKEISSLDAQRTALNANCDALKKRNEALETAMSAIEYYNEVQQEITKNNIDPNKSIFGNIDLNNRQVIEWTDDMVARYQSVIESWGSTTDEFLGTISTVFGAWDEFNDIPIAFSPILQTENGAELLSANTVYEYIYGLLDKAGSDATPEIILRLDAEGLEMDGKQVKNLIADIGTTAEKTSSSMHFLGTDGAIKNSARELATAADEMDMSIEQLLNSYDTFDNEITQNDQLLEGNEANVHSLTDSINEQQKKLNLWAAAIASVTKESDSLGVSLSDLDTVTKEIKSVADAFDEFSKEGKVSVSTLAGLSDKLRKQNSFKKFVDVMTDSASSMKEVRTACNKLAQEYISTSGILDNLNESNAKLIEATLEEIGVINAHEIVQSRLAATQLEAVLAANGLTDATWDEVEAFLKQTGAADNAIIALRNLKIEEYNARLAALDFTTATDSNIEALIKQANAAGVAASKISALNSALSLKQSLEGRSGKTPTFFELNHADELLSGYQKQAQITPDDFTLDLPKVDISSISGGGSGGGGGSSNDDPTKELEDQLNKLLSDFEHKIFILEKKGVSTATDSITDKATQTAQQIVEIYRQMQSAVNKQANTYRSMGLAENSEEIQALQKQWWQYKESIQNVMTSCYEYIQKKHENIIMLNEDWLEGAVDRKDYTDVTRYSSAIISNYKVMQDQLHQQAEYYRSLGYSDTSDEVSKLSDLWWDYANNIKDVKEKVIDYLIDIVDAAHDAVDEIQSVSDTLYSAADEFAANDGFLTVDTYQELIKLGPQYMQMLRDENGLWEINEERINDVIAARTRQLAVENAMSYVKRLQLAAQEGSIEDLNNLCFATTDATNSTWGLVYAELELMHTLGELNDSQYQAAMHNIEAMQNLAVNVVDNIGKETDAVAKNLEKTRKQLEETKDGLQDLLDELEDMEDGSNDLIKYVMEMLKHRIQEQIDLLEEMKDKYSELIDLKKESLDAAKNENDYQKTIAKKLKEMAKLQERINALSLDDSRSAQAERAKLLEELAELQEDLDETQADKAIETQKDALDQMEEDYHAEKDKEIKILEDSISSYQKLYDMAISYIRENWGTLYSELIEWNTQWGTSLNSEITAAWMAAQNAAQRYGDFVSAIMGGISDEIDSITRQIESLDEEISNLNNALNNKDSDGSDKKNTVVGDKTHHTSPGNEDMVRTIVSRMKSYAASWNTANDDATNESLHRKAENLARQLGQYGVQVDFNSSSGTWRITRDDLNPGNSGKLLYNCYHTGGFVGERPLKANERYIKAEDGELMMTSRQQDSLAAQIERISAIANALSKIDVFASLPSIAGGIPQIDRNTINNITNSSRPIEIHVGDTIIQGNASAETVAAHGRMTEKMVNELARMVGVKW